MEAVLLLNASFEPLSVISWKRAVCLAFSGKVEIVKEYEDDIRSVSIVIKAPAVVRLLNYVRIRNRKPPLNRVNIMARDSLTCQYCSKKLTSKTATLDHIIPRSQNGPTSWKNIVCCCKKCNLRKGGRTPKQAQMRLIKEPIIPDWLPVIRIRLNGKFPISWSDFIRRSQVP